jgi:carboxylesterase type B
MQSGSPNSYLGSESKDHSIVKSKSLATSLNCSTTSMAEMVKCLRSKTTDEIIKITKSARANGQSFEPVYGEDLLPIKPYEALEKGKFSQNVDLMFGTVKEEGSLFVESIFPALSPDEKNPTITASKAKQYITLMFLMFKEKYGDAVADFYVTSQGLKDNEKDELRQAVGRAFGDYHITCPTVLYGEAFALHNKTNRVYAYRVTHRPAISVLPLCHGWMGVCHGDDGRYNLFLLLYIYVF